MLPEYTHRSYRVLSLAEAEGTIKPEPSFCRAKSPHQSLLIRLSSAASLQNRVLLFKMALSELTVVKIYGRDLNISKTFETQFGLQSRSADQADTEAPESP